jgi:hypothetical protein
MIDLKSLISWGIVCEGVVGACYQEFQTATVLTVLDAGQS